MHDLNRGSWSTVGITTRQRNGRFVQCTSSHLTSFAVLVGGATGSGREVREKEVTVCIL